MKERPRGGRARAPAGGAAPRRRGPRPPAALPGACGGAGQPHGADLQLHRVQVEAGEAVVEGAEGVGDAAADPPGVEVEADVEADVLDVDDAGARGGGVGGGGGGGGAAG